MCRSLFLVWLMTLSVASRQASLSDACVTDASSTTKFTEGSGPWMASRPLWMSATIRGKLMAAENTTSSDHYRTDVAIHYV
ncbi:hypothetical protein BaRGS_00003194 [Batillaria attramentaria]|uniref:Secreted protein n=1 Tax=Batillaria attramentaria TaxID=370345 RepID=A0ABD0M2A7_9CAEN